MFTESSADFLLDTSQWPENPGHMRCPTETLLPLIPPSESHKMRHAKHTWREGKQIAEAMTEGAWWPHGPGPSPSPFLSPCLMGPLVTETDCEWLWAIRLYGGKSSKVDVGRQREGWGSEGKKRRRTKRDSSGWKEKNRPRNGERAALIADRWKRLMKSFGRAKT